jgi:putative oxidoreductase
MSHSTASMPSRSTIYEFIERPLSWLNRIPYALLALPLRFALATVFWNSAMAKLANWDTTISLFTDEYSVPLLPPEIAAHMAATIELSTPVLLVLGLLTRPAALILLGMTAVIEVFVYPQSWPTHIQWAAMLLILLSRGAGALSVDHLLWRRFGHLLGEGDRPMTLLNHPFR